MIDLRTGNDLYVEGLFSEGARATIALERSFSRGHYLSLSLNAPIFTRGLQSTASAETITLTGDNLYNPSWGLYDGEVRNSRVMKYALPSLQARYERPLNTTTTLVMEFNPQVGRRSISSLGWYDAYNPSPDYYRKLPSYAYASDTKDAIELVWRDQNSPYTQIAWDNLVRYNQLSTDGSAHYIVEEDVELRCRLDTRALLSSRLNERVSIDYGLGYGYQRDRHFKEVVDLLGAEYHLDQDLYIGDNEHSGNDMQNNLRDPNRRVTCGDRFGYDYTALSTNVALLLGFSYRAKDFSVALHGELAQMWMSRIGHYEKERFAGSLSYGSSAVVEMSHNKVDLHIAYSIDGHHHLRLRGSFEEIPMDHEDLFLQIESANRIIDNPLSQSIAEINLAYRYERGDFALDIEGYIGLSRNKTEVWSSYDDMSYTYANAVMSGIGSRSMGINITSNYRIDRNLTWYTTIAVADNTYDCIPNISLYDDSDLSLISSSAASAVEGCKVGNKPQLSVESSLNYFVGRGLILSLDLSYVGGRYLSPSIIRRSDRVVLYAASSSPELAAELIAQESMRDIFDASIGVMKSIYFEKDRRIIINAQIDNLLGDSNRVNYGAESNRILTTSAGSSVASRYLQPSRYRYDTPRTLYLSCSYRF